VHFVTHNSTYLRGSVRVLLAIVFIAQIVWESVEKISVIDVKI
jgi:hypothetical protein